MVAAILRGDDNGAALSHALSVIAMPGGPNRHPPKAASAAAKMSFGSNGGTPSIQPVGYDTIGHYRYVHDGH